MAKHEKISDAAQRFVSVLGTEELVSVLPELRAWLRADPAHRVAFERYQRTLRLVRPLLRATEPGAGKDDFDAFFEALQEEKARMRTEVSNAQPSPWPR